MVFDVEVKAPESIVEPRELRVRSVHWDRTRITLEIPPHSPLEW